VTNVFRYPCGWEPRWYQRPGMKFFDEGGRFAISVHHRRAGKDLTALVQTAKKMLQRVGAYWHVFPTAEQGKKAVWTEFTSDGRRIMDVVFPPEIRKSPKEFSPKGEMVVELKNGSIWRLMGSDKMDVVGAGPVGVVFSEYALAKPNTWDLVRPMIRERNGWVWFISTPRGKNHLWQLMERVRRDPEWFIDVKTLADTRAYDPEATVREERASGMPEELIQQEYFCDFTAANVGSFWGLALMALEQRGGLCAFEHGTEDVFTSWDLGRADDTAIWWWRIGPKGVEVLDHYASHGEDLGHYFAVVRARQQRYGWRYKKHLLPHDAKAKTLATRQSVLEQAAQHFGSGMVALTPELPLLDGIQAVRALLLNEGTRIHTRCSLTAHNRDCDGIEALRAYHREWDVERKCFRETPVHDWSSHTADAMRYVAVMVRVADMLTRKEPGHQPRQPAPLNQSVRMDDLQPAYAPSGRIG
jgi:phage terminase large subunit